MPNSSATAPRSSPSGPRVFAALCAVEHIPPAAPYFVCNKGFASVEVDTSVLPEGAYILRLNDPEIDMNTHIIDAQYHSQSEQDLGTMFSGHISPINGPGDKGAFTLVRFQVVPGNVVLSGPFMARVLSAGPIVGPLPGT